MGRVFRQELAKHRVVLDTFQFLGDDAAGLCLEDVYKRQGYDSVILRGNHKVFYSKAYLGKKKFVYEIDNSLLPIIEIGNNVN